MGPDGGRASAGGDLATQRLPASGEDPDNRTVLLAQEVLERGELLVYPTDTLYALGCRARDPRAVSRLREVKGRDEAKALPLVASDLHQARGLCAAWPDAASLLAEAFWPGPLTLILPSAGDVPDGVTAGSGSVAVRVPALALARALCQAAGALVATSANLAGAPPPRTCDEALEALEGCVSLALDAGPGKPLPSTIVSLLDDEAALVREGQIQWTEIVTFLRRPGRMGS